MNKISSWGYRWLSLTFQLFTLMVMVLYLMLSSCFTSQSSTESSSLLYNLAHNTERTSLMTETTQVLQLYEYSIENSDENRDRGALLTYWRMAKKTEGKDSVQKVYWIRDRAILHLSPRGRSSVQTNVYGMVNATLQFEIQMHIEGSSEWVDQNPTSEYTRQYASIVKDIRNRMLKYPNEF